MSINRTDHAAIRVTDLGEALDWYEGVLGLRVLERNDARAMLACRGEAADLTLLAGGRSIESFAFGVDDRDDLDRIEHRLRDRGVPYERHGLIDRPGTAEVVSLSLPSGHRMEMALGTDGRRAGLTEMVSDGTHRPTDIDHVNLLGEINPEQMSAFMREALGFKQSAALTIQGSWVASWMRATKLDHDLAYMHAVRQTDRLHHIAFAVEDGNHYFRLADRLVETGHRFEYGPGRHMARPRDTKGFGTNTFAYAFDPAGNRNEFSSGMGEFADDESLVVETSVEQYIEIMNGWAMNMPDTFMTLGS